MSRKLIIIRLKKLNPYVTVVLFIAISFLNITEGHKNELHIINFVEIPTECPKYQNPNENIHIAHENDCTKFYQCSHGQKVLKYCPPGLHFNPTLQICDYPGAAGCIPVSGITASTTPSTTVSTTPSTTTSTTPSTTVSTTPSITTSTIPSTTTSTTPSTTTSTTPSTTTSTTPSTTTSTTPSTTTPQTEYPTSCPQYNTPDNIFLPHECICSKYYACYKGLAILQECPDNQHFNPSKHICDDPQNAGCESSTVTPPVTEPSTQSPITQPSTQHGITVPSTQSPVTEPSKWPPITTTGSPTSGECPPYDEGVVVHLPHESDCSMFYKCSHGVKVPMKCSPGMLFQPSLSICDWAINVDC